MLGLLTISTLTLVSIALSTLFLYFLELYSAFQAQKHPWYFLSPLLPWRGNLSLTTHPVSVPLPLGPQIPFLTGSLLNPLSPTSITHRCILSCPNTCHFWKKSRVACSSGPPLLPQTLSSTPSSPLLTLTSPIWCMAQGKLFIWSRKARSSARVICRPAILWGLWSFTCSFKSSPVPSLHLCTKAQHLSSYMPTLTSHTSQFSANAQVRGRVLRYMHVHMMREKN